MTTRGADPRQNVEYREYVEMGKTIKEARTAARRGVRDEFGTVNVPKTAAACPWCGATTITDAAGCCEYCSGAING